MIIFNAKAFLVGICTLLIALLFDWMTGSFGVAMIAGGLAGLLTSVALSRPYTGYLRLPHVFFIPTHVFAVLLVFIGISGLITECRKTPAEKAAEKRADQMEKAGKEKVEAEIELLGTAKYTGDIAFARRLDTIISGMEMAQLEPENNAYLVRYNRDSSKILVLIRIKDVKSLRKETRKEQLGMIVSPFGTEPEFVGRELYFGLISGRKLYMTHNPQATHEASFTHDEAELAGFFDTTTVSTKVTH